MYKPNSAPTFCIGAGQIGLPGKIRGSVNHWPDLDGLVSRHGVIALWAKILPIGSQITGWKTSVSPAPPSARSAAAMVCDVFLRWEDIDEPAVVTRSRCVPSSFWCVMRTGSPACAPSLRSDSLRKAPLTHASQILTPRCGDHAQVFKPGERRAILPSCRLRKIPHLTPAYSIARLWQSRC